MVKSSIEMETSGCMMEVNSWGKGMDLQGNSENILKPGLTLFWDVGADEWRHHISDKFK